jgi:hypothetical protein
VKKEMIMTDALGTTNDYLIAYLSAAQFGIIQHWFETGMVFSPREMALMLARFIQNSPLQVVIKR